MLGFLSTKGGLPEATMNENRVKQIENSLRTLESQIVVDLYRWNIDNETQFCTVYLNCLLYMHSIKN